MVSSSPAASRSARDETSTSRTAESVPATARCGGYHLRGDTARLPGPSRPGISRGGRRQRSSAASLSSQFEDRLLASPIASNVSPRRGRIVVTPEEAREFVSTNHRAVLITYRRRGLQTSPVTVGIDNEGK